MDRNMKKWHSYKLSDVVRFNPSERLLKGEIAKKVPMDLLQPYTRGISGFEMASYTGGSKFRNGDTLMARITPCLENGKTAYVSMLDEDEVGFGSTEYIVFRNIEGITDNKFVYYFVTSPWFRDIAVKSMVGSSGRQRVQQAMLENLVVNLPPLAEQKQIAGILGALDDKIELNRCINDNLEQQAQALFKSWFVDFEPFRGGEFVDSALGSTPKELPIVYIEDIPHNIESGKRPKGGATFEGVPSIGAENIKGLGYYDYSKTKYIPKEYAQTIKKGKINGYELLIYKDGGKPGYFIPNFSIFGEGFPFNEMYINEHVFILDLMDNAYNAFAYFYMRTPYIMNQLNSIGGKAAIPGINTKDIECLPIYSNESPYVKRYGDIVLPFIKTILSNSLENARLAKMRDTLLPKLMSGKLKISEIEI